MNGTATAGLLEQIKSVVGEVTRSGLRETFLLLAGGAGTGDVSYAVMVSVYMYLPGKKGSSQKKSQAREVGKETEGGVTSGRKTQQTITSTVPVC